MIHHATSPIKPSHGNALLTIPLTLLLKLEKSASFSGQAPVWVEQNKSQSRIAQQVMNTWHQQTLFLTWRVPWRVSVVLATTTEASWEHTFLNSERSALINSYVWADYNIILSWTWSQLHLARSANIREKREGDSNTRLATSFEFQWNS